MALLEVQHISKQLKGGLLIDQISFEQKLLQKIAIAGESGAGKTILLKMISGHAQPDSGTILFNGQRVIGPEEKLLAGHKEIGYLSQEHDLLHNYKVEDLVWFQNKLSDEESTTLFEICRIADLMKRKTDQLAGGEKQRIALCMLLTKSPKMLILDEPFSNLDPIHTNILKSVLEDITERLQITCLLTSHDPNDTLSWADEIIVMKKGRIIQQSTPEIIYHHPVNEYVAGMFGRYNLLIPEQAILFGIEANEKNVIIRPEDFIISANSENGVRGIVEKISFWGSFYEVEVRVDEFSIVVRLGKNEWEVGKEVYVCWKS
ncbi:MAG TPA: ABC transporter ATP-binding protein [Hanamia sp.]|nr:ABC transporter ATP-binding protein [Hanamia sp.]